MDQYETQAIDEAVADAIEERYAPDRNYWNAGSERRPMTHQMWANFDAACQRVWMTEAERVEDDKRIEALLRQQDRELPPEPQWEAALWDAADEAYERHMDRARA